MLVRSPNKQIREGKLEWVTQNILVSGDKRLRKHFIVGNNSKSNCLTANLNILIDLVVSC